MEQRDTYGYSTEDIQKNHGNPIWEAIWATIKDWDIGRNHGEEGYSLATGSDVQRIFDVVNDALQCRETQTKKLIDTL